MTPVETDGGDVLTAVMEWIGSIFAPDRPIRGASDPEPPPTKEGSGYDPHGSSGGG
jgi:hypothetical protein